MCVSHVLCVLSVCAMGVQCMCGVLSVSGACYECVTRVSRVLCVLIVPIVCVQWLCSACAGH